MGAVYGGCIWGLYICVCFNCAIYGQIVNYTKSCKNFNKTYCNLHEFMYNKDSYTETCKNNIKRGS